MLVSSINTIMEVRPVKPQISKFRRAEFCEICGERQQSARGRLQGQAGSTKKRRHGTIQRVRDCPEQLGLIDHDLAVEGDAGGARLEELFL